jgi:hypothetical protein
LEAAESRVFWNNHDNTTAHNLDSNVANNQHKITAQQRILGFILIIENLFGNTSIKKTTFSKYLKQSRCCIQDLLKLIPLTISPQNQRNQLSNHHKIHRQSR